MGIQPGDNVEIFLDESDQRLVVRKRLSLKDLRALNQKRLGSRVKPVTDAGEYWLNDRMKKYGKS